MIILKRLWGSSVFLVSALLCVSLASLCGHIAGRTSATAVQSTADVQTIKLPIVMYHHVLKEQARLNKYTVSPAELRCDFEYIKAQGYTAVLPSELIEYCEKGTPLPKRPIMISFDDGHESFYEYVYPMLREYGYKAVFSPVGVYTDRYSTQEDHHISYSHCTWSELKELQQSGLVEIENHSYNLHENKNGRHGSKKKQGESDGEYRKVLLDDIGKMQDECENFLGVRPNTFTYPYGQISAEALPILKEMGFKAALICQEKFNYLTGEPEELYHLNRFNRAHNDSLKAILERAESAE